MAKLHVFEASWILPSEPLRGYDDLCSPTHPFDLLAFNYQMILHFLCKVFSSSAYMLFCEAKCKLSLAFISLHTRLSLKTRALTCLVHRILPVTLLKFNKCVEQKMDDSAHIQSLLDHLEPLPPPMQPSFSAQRSQLCICFVCHGPPCPSTATLALSTTVPLPPQPIVLDTVTSRKLHLDLFSECCLELASTWNHTRQELPLGNMAFAQLNFFLFSQASYLHRHLLHSLFILSQVW